MPSLTKVQTGFVEAQGALPLSSGTAAAPGLKFDDHAGTGMFSPSTGEIAFSTSSHQQALTLNTAGRLGLGASNNTAYDSNAQNLLIASDGNTGMTIRSAGSTPFAMIHFADGTSGQAQQRAGRIMYQHDGDNLSFHTANDERLRINGDGKVLVTGQAALTSTSLSHPFQVAAASDANTIAIIGRASDDIGELSFYEADKSTKLGELQYRRDHLNFRHRVGYISFAAGGVAEKFRITSTGELISYNGTLRRDISTSSFTVTGDTASNTGANINLYGASHSSLANVFRVRTGATERFRISSGGNIGINRIDPDQRLNVNGNIEVNAYDSSSGSGGYYTAKGLIIGNLYDAGKSYTGSDDRTGCIWQERGLDLDFATNNTYRMKLTYDGKLIISNTQRATPFLAADGGICIEQSYDGNLYGLAIRNKDTSAAASTGLVFSLDRSSGSSQDFAGGSITLHKEQDWTTTSSTVGGQLKLSTIYQGTLRGRLIIGGGGFISNVKGGNTVYAGSTILGTYKYVQNNQGSGHQHNILGPDGRNLNVYLNNNVGVHIYIKVLGTGSLTSYCEYYYENNSSVSGATLTHLRGNSGSSSNRPYMGLNGQIPYWTMAHSGQYVIDVRVQMMGGRTYSSYYQAGETAYTSNP